MQQEIDEVIQPTAIGERAQTDDIQLMVDFENATKKGFITESIILA